MLQLNQVKSIKVVFAMWILNSGLLSKVLSSIIRYMKHGIYCSWAHVVLYFIGSCWLLMWCHPEGLMVVSSQCLFLCLFLQTRDFSDSLIVLMILRADGKFPSFVAFESCETFAHAVFHKVVKGLNLSKRPLLCPIIVLEYLRWVLVSRQLFKGLGLVSESIQSYIICTVLFLSWPWYSVVPIMSWSWMVRPWLQHYPIRIAITSLPVECSNHVFFFSSNI